MAAVDSAFLPAVYSVHSPTYPARACDRGSFLYYFQHIFQLLNCLAFSPRLNWGCSLYSCVFISNSFRYYLCLHSTVGSDSGCRQGKATSLSGNTSAVLFLNALLPLLISRALSAPYQTGTAGILVRCIGSWRRGWRTVRGTRVQAVLPLGCSSTGPSLATAGSRLPVTAVVPSLPS
jgi:hypothetical protein